MRPWPILALLAGCSTAAAIEDAGSDAAVPDASTEVDASTSPPVDGGVAADASAVDGGRIDVVPPNALIRGVRFDPEVLTADGVDHGGSWLEEYDQAEVRALVRDELRAIRPVTTLTHVAVFAVSARQLAWPRITSADANRLVDFVGDANDAGLSVILVLGTPCVVPNASVPAGATPEHVGGHRTGDVVNGRTLGWDIPRCGGPSEAVEFYDSVLDALSRARPGGVAYLALGGHPFVPFTAELPLHTAFPYRADVETYLATVIPALRSRDVVPIGVTTQVASWTSTPVDRYSFIAHLDESVGLANLDVIDVTSFYDRDDGSGSIDITDLARAAGPAASRLVLSDFGFRSSSRPPADVLEWTLAGADTLGGRGFWIWQYKDDAGSIGLRMRGYFGPTEAGFRPELLAPIRATD